MGDEGHRRTREEYERGLPDYHDPTARWAGAPPARSALTLRLWLAGWGFLTCAAGAILVAVLTPLLWLAVVLGVLALIALGDFVWVTHRKRRGEPG